MSTEEQEHVTFAIKLATGDIKRLAKNGSLDEALALVAVNADSQLCRVSQDGRACYPVRTDYDVWGERITVRDGDSEVIDRSAPPDTKTPAGRAALLLAANLNALPKKPGWAEAARSVMREHTAEARQHWQADADKRAERLAAKGPPMTASELANQMFGDNR